MRQERRRGLRDVQGRKRNENFQIITPTTKGMGVSMKQNGVINSERSMMGNAKQK